MTMTNSREKHILTAISTGGGIIEVIGIDGIGVSMAGDYYETLYPAGSVRRNCWNICRKISRRMKFSCREMSIPALSRSNPRVFYPRRLCSHCVHNSISARSNRSRRCCRSCRMARSMSLSSHVRRCWNITGMNSSTCGNWRSNMSAPVAPSARSRCLKK